MGDSHHELEDVRRVTLIHRKKCPTRLMGAPTDLRSDVHCHLGVERFS
jgi:hypothetical protein